MAIKPRRRHGTSRPRNSVMQAQVPRIERPRPGAPCSRPNWRFGPFGRGAETGSPPRQNGPPAQLAGSHGALVTAGPRQLGTKAAGQAGSPRRAALVEPHAASTSLLSQRPAHPTHRPGRARPRGPSWRRQAAVRVRNGRPDVPAGCLPGRGCLLPEPLLRCSALPVCSGPAAAVLSLFEPCSVRQLSGVLGGAGGAACGIGRVQKRVLWSDLNVEPNRPVLSF